MDFTVFLWFYYFVSLLKFVTGNDYYSESDEETLSRERRSVVNFYRTGQKLQGEMSRTLNQLLGPNYNKRIRPSYGGPPVIVELNLSIRAIGPVDEKKQDFFIDCYFRQSWKDDRLVFNNSGVKELPMNWQFLNKIWKPDTFFVNGKKSKMHKITVPNKFLRITPNGQVSYSQRLTIHARCRMHLLKFPLDSQVCPLWIGSYGYASKDVIFEWRKPSGFSIDNQQTAQFHITKYDIGIINNTTNRLIESGFRNDSVAFLHFFFERQTGFFLLQIYTPLLVIVMCSWVAFWIVRTDAPARCALGITTVLSVTKIGFGGKGKPQVGYPTAMDVFVIICLGSVFAALCEFAILNFISVFMTRYKAEEEKVKEAQEKAKDLLEKVTDQMIIASKKPAVDIFVDENIDDIQPIEEIKEDDENWEAGPNPFAGKTETPNHKKSVETMDVSTTTDDFHKPCCFDCQEQLDQTKIMLNSWFQILTTRPKWLKIKPVPKMYIYTNTEEALDYIDDCSKVYFPLAFLLLMLVYWTSYLFVIQDKLEMDTF